MSAMALNLRRWRIAVATHDVENPAHHSFGIGVNGYDLGRLGLEDGEELWPGIRIEQIDCSAGNFKVLCDGDHTKLKPHYLDEKTREEANDAEPIKTIRREPVSA